jgi:hypothetical protein
VPAVTCLAGARAILPRREGFMRARVSWLVVAVVAGCTSSSLSPGGSSPADLSLPAPADLEQPIAPSSALLSGVYYLNGITSDGQLVVTGPNSTNVSLLPPAGGTPTQIGTANFVDVRGNVVLLFTNVDVSAGLYQLSAWSASGGLHSLSDATTLYLLPQLSSDGQYLLYFDNVSGDGSTGDLVTAKLDGSDHFTLISQTPTGNSITSGCYPYADFLGGGFVLSYCDHVDADAGSALGNVATVDPRTGTLTQVVSDANYSYFVVNAAHQQAYSDDDLYNGILFGADGKPKPFAEDVDSALFDRDGTVIYATFTDLDRYSPAVHFSTTLQPTPVNSFLELVELSPDGKTALLSLNTSTSSTTYGQDLWAVALTPNAPLSPILKQASGLPVEYFAGGSSFTSDSKYVFFESPLDPTNYTAPLRVAPIAGGDGVGTMVAGSALQILTTHDSFALVCANPDSSNNCDLLLVDAANPSSVQKLDTLVQGYSLFLSSDRKTLFYSVSDGARSGIYRLPL